MMPFAALIGRIRQQQTDLEFVVLTELNSVK
jgi:hypothetical protein